VLKAIRTGVIVVVLLCLSLSGGVALAEAPDPDGTEQDGDYKDTADGNWRLHVYLDHVAITSVPNMAATAFTREAYVSATATVWVEALGDPNVPSPRGAEVMQRSIALWLQEGCQVGVFGANVSLNNSSQTGLQGTASSTGTTSITPNASENPNPQYQQTLAPGTIKGKNLQNKAYPDPKPVAPPGPPPWVVGPGWKNDTLTVSVRNWDMPVDDCAGPVSFRFDAEAVLSTPRFDVNVDAFSAIVQV
jgi:hypothetical protein